MHHKDKDPRQVRLLRRHKRNKPASIMLTSMIDIFTVLVFFLIVNAQNQVRLPNNQAMQVPKSVSQDFPRETLTIQVTPSDLFVDTVHIGSVPEILNTSVHAGMIPGLAQELRYRAGHQNLAMDPDHAYHVYILADRRISYRLLRLIMVTCSQNSFSHISFAVERAHSGDKA